MNGKGNSHDMARIQMRKNKKWIKDKKNTYSFIV